MDQALADLRLRFVSQALPGDAFSVVSFEASEGLSQLYAVSLELVSSRRDLDLDAVMAAPASCAIGRSQGEVPFHGILETFTEGSEANGLYFYQARLRPRLWRLTLESRNQVFVDEAIPTVLQKVLTDGGLPGSAFAFRLQGSYPSRDFLCQYRETLYDFLLRWMARYGLYYFFEQGPSGETVVITDTKIAHTPAPGGTRLVYARTSGLETLHAQETAHDFGSRRTLGPSQVTLKDYNYRKPDLDLSAQRPQSLKGEGEAYCFGDHYRTPSEGESLARLRAEALTAAGKQVFGTSFAPWLRPGYTFELADHFNRSQNGTYLALTVTHKGRATMAGTAGLDPASGGQARLHYENTFTAMDAGTQYRPPQVPRSTLAGLMTARVDAAGSGTYAELDEDGRYKIRLPFDQSGLADGKASAPVRLLQPFVGSGFGLHCPLHKGTEVALGYVDGNPDRPVILGAAPNPENKSQVTNDTQTQCRLTTGAGHKLHIEDQEGSQRILLQSATGDFLRIGAHNDPASTDTGGYFSEKGISLYAPGNHWMQVTCQNEMLVVFGEYMLNILGWYTQTVGLSLEIDLTLKISLYLALKVDFENLKEAYEGFEILIHPQKQTFSANNQQITVAQIRATDNTTATALSSSQQTLDTLDVAQTTVDTAGQRSQATAQEFEACQRKSALAAGRTQAYQDAIQLSQTKQDLAASKVVMGQSEVDSAVEKTSMFTSLNEEVAEGIKTATNKIETVANELSTFGIYTKN
jgi:type VI secretion system secreted protein VgrG